uniref:Uncharacterized protein n=1 Tax=Aegilops tauschii subsp. strangulata TaxID=200361 RepID=A0A452Y767_AEGTS
FAFQSNKERETFPFVLRRLGIWWRRRQEAQAARVNRCWGRRTRCVRSAGEPMIYSPSATQLVEGLTGVFTHNDK